MKHRKFTRVLSVLLALLVLVGPGALTTNAASTSTSTGSSSSVDQLTDLLSAIKYSEYLEKYAKISAATTTVKIEGDALLQYAQDITDAYTCTCDKDNIDENCPCHLKNSEGKAVTDSDGNLIPKFVKDTASIVHTGQIAIVQEKEGKIGLYIPNERTVGWKVNIPEEAMYNIIFEYYANDGTTGEVSKTTSIERSLYINGRVPFYEARFLSLTKVWKDELSSYAKDADGNYIYETDEDGNILLDAMGNKIHKFHTDIYGNEIKADKEQAPEWRVYNCMDSTGYVTTPLLFYFKSGENTLELEAQREAFFVSSITLAQPEVLPTYEEYYNALVAAGAKDYTGAPIQIQAERPTATSENTVYATNDRTSAITMPQDAANILMNSIGGDGGEKWQTLGQWVRYQINAPEDGFYNIVLRFKQSVLEGTFSARTLRVRLAGEDVATVPFNEAYYLQFNYSDDWQVNGLNSGDVTVNYRIYLKKGVNDIELEASFGNMSEILRRVNNSLTTINNIYIKILRITGATPDNNRDYGFYDIMPDDCDELLVQAAELQAISDMFTEITGTTGSHAKTLETVSMLLEKMGSHEDNIAKNLGNLKEKLGTLGTWLQTSMSQPLQIDYISVQSPTADKKDYPKAVENFFQALWYEISMFFVSFTNNYDSLGAVEIVEEENKITVWTTLGRDQAQIIRNLITNGYNSKTQGYSVVLELVAGGSLIPSILAGVGPDISMGHGSSDVINWAIRSAVVSIDEMEGYDELTQALFSEAATIPLTLRELYWSQDVSAEEKAIAYPFTTADYQSYLEYNKTCARGEELTLGQYAYKLARSKGYYAALYVDEADGKEYYYKESVYGLPETQSFSMLFYRADIFLDLGIEAPTTWQEFLAIVPTLQKNKMEVAFPTSGGGLNLFLYQMGGELYADDGREIAIDSNLGLEAFEYLCQFFEQYRFPVSYDFSNRFRSGEIPIGIMDYGTYTQLSVYATEIKGLWQFVPLPSYVVYDDDGNVTYSNNDAVSGVSAMIMVKNDDRTEDKTKAAWEFMKWYVSTETQTEYASELTALLGSVSKHNTANKIALESLPWTTTEKNNLKAQFENLAAIPEYPGSYIISRYVNFAFMAVYNDNADAADSLQSYIIEINKELTRKRKEFGMAYYEISFSAQENSD